MITTRAIISPMRSMTISVPPATNKILLQQLSSLLSGVTPIAKCVAINTASCVVIAIKLLKLLAK